MLSVFPLAGCVKENNTEPADTPDPNTAYVTEAPTDAPTDVPTAEPTAEPTRTPAATPEPLFVPVFSDELVFTRGFPPCNDMVRYGLLPFDNFMQVIKYVSPDGQIFDLPVRETGKNNYAFLDTESGYRVYYPYKYFGKNIYMIGCPMIIKDVHSYSEFTSLKIGDPIDAVNEIDPAAGLVKMIAEKESSTITPERAAQWQEQGFPYMSCHYLTDGILRINYTMDENGELFIYDMVYSEDYNLWTDSIYCTKLLNYEILPCDLPPAWQEVMGG
jgi:hypothetical protein